MAVNYGKGNQETVNSSTNILTQKEEYSITDNELIALSAAGDGMSSFAELYCRYYRRGYCICLRMTSNVADAEDLAQDVFIQLQRNLHSFRGESSFLSWLHRITVNQVLMRFRKKSTRCELTTDSGEMPDVVMPNTESPMKMPIIDHIALADAIDQLPNGYRKVFLLHDVEGYEHQEIGQILGITEGTSKSQLHKARMKLRTILLKRTGENQEVNKSNVKKMFMEERLERVELLAA